MIFSFRTGILATTTAAALAAGLTPGVPALAAPASAGRNPGVAPQAAGPAAFGASAPAGVTTRPGGPGTPSPLPLGDADLAETRTTKTLARGVTLTRITRGTEPAPADQINTTTRGPWVVNVLAIDPRRARGHLEATYGPDLGQVEPTTELVRGAGALAGVNASFFTFTADPLYPGDPVGLGIFGGRLLSEPTTDPAEVGFVVDAARDTVLMGHLSWTGSVRNRRTGAALPLEFLNHPPVVPAECAALTDQTLCTVSGDLVHFTPEFGPSTPSGAGVEVVLDRDGCPARTATTRGTSLAAGQTALQATGREAAALRDITATGCLTRRVTLRDPDGDAVDLRPGLFGVNGRYPLTADGRVVVPAGTGSFFARNPRTVAGTTRDGRIVLATIDGRQTTSVGTTMDETAAVAHALGLHDAVNLDGGGSTTMSVRGALVNTPSGGAERAVGDALVYVDRPWRAGHR
ncbi:phosphodiester glycosidase family protein [Phytohabitans sp. ZYX-F-186]|uniref:Phosphodiester glycosidase family protein n=1 Tax=Phytohabitans maris TaxID=3071409 RepID=A0ABU0ZM89_9ACTN|nr:phosphodiester glycosidase family protein [Phytohabitans sp. ZYX-F-186]MDQ7908157.1 phosphodiester glycosidase family protein [Phytohabitans sp. ZYX-F-186]